MRDSSSNDQPYLKRGLYHLTTLPYILNFGSALSIAIKVKIWYNSLVCVEKYQVIT